MVIAEMSIFSIFRGRNVRGRNVQAKTSLAEMSVAEMSKHPFDISSGSALFAKLKAIFREKYIGHFKAA